VSCTVLHEVLWVLIVVSLLLTARAGVSGSWQTMWVAALVSLAFCLIAIWSIGSLLAILTCFQLAAAVALRRAVDMRGWAALLISAPIAFLLVVYGLAVLQAERFWPIAFPLAFALGSLLLIGDFPARWRPHGVME
jgi:hypothetical protein